MGERREMSQQQQSQSPATDAGSSAESATEEPGSSEGTPTSAPSDAGAKAAPVVTDAPERHRFEIHVGGELAGFTVYRLQRDRFAFTHTEIDPRFSGGGLASILVRGALDEMRRREIAVLPYCPFVRRYISRHLEYLDLVPADAREEFDLPQT